jgi:hypothetical protein
MNPMLKDTYLPLARFVLDNQCVRTWQTVVAQVIQPYHAQEWIYVDTYALRVLSHHLSIYVMTLKIFAKQSVWEDPKIEEEQMDLVKATFQTLTHLIVQYTQLSLRHCYN